MLDSSAQVQRVLYLDGESTKQELRWDIHRMLQGFSDDERTLVEENLMLVCDDEISDEPLTLDEALHMSVIERLAVEFKPDLIVLDTITALIDITDENDNAKIKVEVMKPLKALAIKANAAILLLHHSGKYNENSSSVGAYKGRGASALGALARAVIVLEKSDTGKNRI
jgi:RecA-family ATPase